MYLSQEYPPEGIGNGCIYTHHVKLHLLLVQTNHVHAETLGKGKGGVSTDTLLPVQEGNCGDFRTGGDCQTHFQHPCSQVEKANLIWTVCVFDNRFLATKQ